MSNSESGKTVGTDDLLCLAFTYINRNYIFNLIIVYVL